MAVLMLFWDWTRDEIEVDAIKQKGKTWSGSGQDVVLFVIWETKPIVADVFWRRDHMKGSLNDN